MGEPTAQEVLMQALINRARLNPAGEAARYGIALNEGVPAGSTISTASKQPLAFSNILQTSADLHSQNMIDRDFFAHNDPLTGTTPQSRATAAGYTGLVGENIAWSGSTAAINATQMIYDQHRDLFVDAGVANRGHRTNILNASYDEVGVGQVIGVFTSNGTNFNASMVTEDFGITSASSQFLVVTAYNDNDGDEFYSVGEGRGNISVATSSGTFATGAAGAYARTIASGAQTVTFSGGDLVAAVSVTATITAGTNALVNLVGQSTVETSTSLTAGNGVLKIVGVGNFGLTLTGNAAANSIVSALGNDNLNGGDGFGTAVYSSNRASYTITQNANGSVTVSGLDGTDTLSSVERLQFKDMTVAIGNTPPVATIADHMVKLNEWALVQNWLSYSDANNNPAVRYQFYDSGAEANSGYFWTPNNSHHAANTNITVEAADLGSAWIRGGATNGTETMWVRAFDGTAWSEWDAFTFTSQNLIPVATIDNHSLQTNQWAQIRSWINYSDADGNAAVRYQFHDAGGAANSGYFWTPTNDHVAANINFTVEATDLGSVWVRGGTAGQSETMWVRAFDGNDWSAWDSFTLTTLPNNAPVATIADHSLQTNQWAKLADWTAYSDADGNPAVQYQIHDAGGATNSGYFWTPTNDHNPAAVNITLTAAEFANTWVRGGRVGGSETMLIRAFDGTDWSAWDSFKLTTLPNDPPTATIENHTVHVNEWARVSDWLTYRDANGNAPVQYQFWDDGVADSSGYFWTPDNPHQPANDYIIVKAADINGVWVRGGQSPGTENMWVRVFDGTDWSAWDLFTFTTIA